MPGLRFANPPVLLVLPQTPLSLAQQVGEKEDFKAFKVRFAIQHPCVGSEMLFLPVNL